MNIKDASSAGYLLRAEHVAKPHNSETARLNLERIEGISSILKNLEAEVTTDLNGTVNSKGRIKSGWKTAHDFDECVLTKIRTMRENIEKTKTELVEFENRVASVFKFKFAGHKRKSLSKKQNKHLIAARKKIREGKRTAEVLQKIAPALGEGSVYNEANLDDRAIAQLGKRDRKWALLLVSGSQLLTEKAQRHLKAILKEDDAADAPISIVPSDSEEVDQMDGGSTSTAVDDCASQAEAICFLPLYISSSEEEWPYFEHLSEESD